MRTSLNLDVLNRITYLTGSVEIVRQFFDVPAKIPFDGTVIDFLNDVSKILMSDKRSKAYSDLVTFGFWIRQASTLKLKERFVKKDSALHLGKGVAFHIAPSNVPINFAYSLVAGLLTGNANIVRVPSRDFAQINILVEAFNKVLLKREDMKPYILLIRYERDKDINDFFSSIADIRIVWGGNATIDELRKSSLPPRAGEVTFADRYSLAVIDSDSYLALQNKTKAAEDFYNDTFFSDQNACTSPRIIVWTGKQIEKAKEIFWEEEYKLVKKKYTFQAIQGVNKLTSSCLIAVAEPGSRIEKHKDNLIVRVTIPKVTDNLMNYRDSGGYFFEYNCEDIMNIQALCNDKRCQTIAYIGNNKVVLPLIQAGVKGIDRIVPMGKTMDFDLIWDGYDLTSLMTRTITLL